MSTVNENPTLTCPPTALEACPAPLPPVAPLSAEEGPPRPSKSALLPEIARLALAGHSGREIGKRLGVPRRTVARWLQELRQEWAASAAEDAAQLVSVTLARLELAYREATEAWRRSLADKEMTTETPGDDGGASPRTCVRRATQSGQAAMLGKVIHAAKEVYTFKQNHLHARRQAEAAESNRVCRELAEELRKPRRFGDWRDHLHLGGNERACRSPRSRRTGRGHQPAARRGVPHAAGHAVERLQSGRAVPAGDSLPGGSGG